MKEDVLQKDVNNLSESSSIETAFHDSYVLSKQEETFFFSDMHLTCTKDLTPWKESNILLVGVGGLGCEILKNLLVNGFTKISLVDYDIVSYSNLCRQLFYRKQDIGKFKVNVAAQFIHCEEKWRHVLVTPYTQRIEHFPKEFFYQFDLVLGGLDNVETRRCVNSILHDIVQFRESKPVMRTVKPYIDGGTEGFRGQCRTIIPFFTSCFECSLDLFPDSHVNLLPICTPKTTFTTPEECIIYTSTSLWTQYFFEKELNLQDERNLQWIVTMSNTLARKSNIESITRDTVLNVLKNVIATVTSTNALIASVIVLEATRILTHAATHKQNYFMYMGDTSTYSFYFRYERNEKCNVCCQSILHLTIHPHMTLENILLRLRDQHNVDITLVTLSCRNQLIFVSHSQIKWTKKSYLNYSYEYLLKENILVPDEPLIITDRNHPTPLRLYLQMDSSSY